MSFIETQPAPTGTPGRASTGETDAACCAPATRDAIGAEAAERLARSLKALADPGREDCEQQAEAHRQEDPDREEPVGEAQPCR